MTCHWGCNKSNTTDVTNGAGTSYPSGVSEFTSVLVGVHVAPSFLCSVLYIIVCPFVLFLFAIVLSVLLFTASDYLFGILSLLFWISLYYIWELWLQGNAVAHWLYRVAHLCLRSKCFAQYYLCFWIVHYCLSFRFSLTKL
jgi:Zn-dependent protease with chaperone function